MPPRRPKGAQKCWNFSSVNESIYTAQHFSSPVCWTIHLIFRGHYISLDFCKKSFWKIEISFLNLSSRLKGTIEKLTGHCCRPSLPSTRSFSPEACFNFSRKELAIEDFPRMIRIKVLIHFRTASMFRHSRPLVFAYARTHRCRLRWKVQLEKCRDSIYLGRLKVERNTSGLGFRARKCQTVDGRFTSQSAIWWKRACDIHGHHRDTAPLPLRYVSPLMTPCCPVDKESGLI